MIFKACAGSGVAGSGISTVTGFLPSYVHVLAPYLIVKAWLSATAGIVRVTASVPVYVYSWSPIVIVSGSDAAGALPPPVLIGISIAVLPSYVYVVPFTVIVSVCSETVPPPPEPPPARKSIIAFVISTAFPHYM